MFELCEICDNFTSTVVCPECQEEQCEICFNAYGCGCQE